ncbi:MAG: hypothetical protein AAF432_07270 [Planctomycetota bacterium]
MTRSYSLEQLEIASQCDASWDDMAGDERRRFCDQCSLHVYNVAGMTREDAEAMIESHEGRLCMRLYRREDGTVMTSDCPVGLAAVRAAARRAVGRVASCAAFVLATVFAALQGTSSRHDIGGLEDSPVVSSVNSWLNPPPGLGGGVCTGVVMPQNFTRPPGANMPAPVVGVKTNEDRLE